MTWWEPKPNDCMSPNHNLELTIALSTYSTVDENHPTLGIEAISTRKWNIDSRVGVIIIVEAACWSQ